MSMLDRYKKTGGFKQILNLVETCGPQKQAKFLELIQAEDPRWADAIRMKMIDINRIYSWPDENLSEVIGVLLDLTLGVALHGAPVEVRDRILKLIDRSRKRKIDDIYDTSKPTPAEIATMNMKIIETVRKLAHDGTLRFEKFDQQLMIDDDFEAHLLRPAGHAPTEPTNSSAAKAASKSMFTIEYDNDAGAPAEQAPAPQQATASAAGPDRTAEVVALKKKVDDLSKENATLKHELNVARNKLDQIKKIA